MKLKKGYYDMPPLMEISAGLTLFFLGLFLVGLGASLITGAIPWK